MARTRVGVVVVLVLFIGLVEAPAQAEGQGYDWSAVDARLEEAVEVVDGLALSIATGDDPLYEKAFGEWAIEDNTGIASATKWTTAATLLTLVDEGLLSLDRPIAEHLPLFAIGDKSEITLRHLLSHTSGIVTQHPCLFNNRYMTLEECATQIAAAPLMFAPGSRFHYGAGAMQVAGHMAEVVTGQPWAELFSERIAAPLQMEQTIYAGPRGENDTDSPVHQATGRAHEYPNPHIAAGIDTTLRDYDLVLAMLHRGGTTGDGEAVLAPASVAELERTQTGDAEYPTCPIDGGFCGDTRGFGLVYGDPSGEQIPYGLGTWMWRTGSDGRATLATSPGAWGTTPWIDRCSNYRAVLIMNASGKDARPIFEDLARLIEAELSGSPEGPTTCDSGI